MKLLFLDSPSFGKLDLIDALSNWDLQFSFLTMKNCTNIVVKNLMTAFRQLCRTGLL